MPKTTAAVREETTRKSIPLKEIQGAHGRATEERHKLAIQRILEWMRTDSVLVEMLSTCHITALRANGVTV